MVGLITIQYSAVLYEHEITAPPAPASVFYQGDGLFHPPPSQIWPSTVSLLSLLRKFGE
jgi:hypothetical protein